MEKTLDQFNINELGVVVKITGQGKIRRRLFDMGITKGAKVFLRKKAPLNDPIEINIRNYELSLRKNEAMWVVCQTIESEEENNV